MSGLDLEGSEWTGCAHCSQTLPHEGTSWRESARCRMFQRIAEKAWDEGYRTSESDFGESEENECDVYTANPYRAAQVAPSRVPGEET